MKSPLKKVFARKKLCPQHRQLTIVSAGLGSSNSFARRFFHPDFSKPGGLRVFARGLIAPQ
jgi:hypothetical protein